MNDIQVWMSVLELSGCIVFVGVVWASIEWLKKWTWSKLVK